LPTCSLFTVGSVVPGAGAFEVAVNAALTEYKKLVKGRARLGVQVKFLLNSVKGRAWLGVQVKVLLPERLIFSRCHTIFSFTQAFTFFFLF